MGCDGARIDLGDDAAERHQIGAARELECQRRLLLDQDDRQAFAVEQRRAFPGSPRSRAAPGRARARRAAGASGRPSARGRPPASAARRRRASPAVWCSRSFRRGNSENTRSRRRASSALSRRQIGAELEVFGDLIGAKMPRPSGTSTMPRAAQRPAALRGSASPAKAHAAAIRDQAHDRAHQCRLAGAVRPEHGDEFAVRDRQVAA